MSPPINMLLKNAYNINYTLPIVVCCVITALLAYYLFKSNTKVPHSKYNLKTHRKLILSKLIHAIENHWNRPINVKACINILQHDPTLINCTFPPEIFSPFLVACMQGSTELVSFMIKNGAAINLSDTTGRSPVFYAAVAIIRKKVHSFAILKLLIDAGCNINAEGYRNYTALRMAAHFGHSSLVRWLLMRGADPQLPSEKLTPYRTALKQGHKETAALLYINVGQ